MEISNLTQNIHTNLANLVADRDQLREALKYAQSTITELTSQNRELDILLTNAQALLQSSSQFRPAKFRSKISWIGGTWSSSPVARQLLTPVESAWKRGHVQQALALLTLVVLEKGITHSQRCEAELLFSAIMRSSGDVKEALAHAEKSLGLAKDAQLYDLVGKAQFHRGLCYLYNDRYADARWCFILASHTPGHEELVAINREMAEQRMGDLPFNDPRRILSVPIF